MKAASDVSELDNDAELLTTLHECESTDDWIASLKTHPGAGALLDYTTEDAENLLGIACMSAAHEQICIDASDAGILTYDLDDPRLKE